MDSIVCEKPIHISMQKGTIYMAKKYPDGLLVACGKCHTCRKIRTLQWSKRITDELPYWNQNALFITLTYDNENCPKDYSVKKEDLQKYIKRVRKDLSSKLRVIKYYACAEYGEKLQRPHYHIIMFGVNINDVQMLTEKWGLGIVHTGTVNASSARYVAQYVDKKYYGKQADNEYFEKNRQPANVYMSKGIGKKYAEENKEKLKQGYDTVNGKKIGLSRYYKKVIGFTDDEKQKLVKQMSLKLLKDMKSTMGDSFTWQKFYIRLSQIRSRMKNDSNAIEKNKIRGIL